MSKTPTTTDHAPNHIDKLSLVPPEHNFQMIRHEDIGTMMLADSNSVQGDGEETISFIDSINTLYQKYPTMASLHTLHKRVPDTNPAHHLVTSAILTQFWLYLKKKRPDGNTEAIQGLEQEFIRHWNLFVSE